MSFLVELRERGDPAVISRERWSALGLEVPLRRMAAAGILSVQHSAEGVIIVPSHYVGAMQVPGAIIRVREKSENLLAGMRRLALRPQGKTTSNYLRRVSDDGPLRNNLVGAFVDALSEAVSEGIPWRYSKVTHSTSNPRGKLEFSKTLSRLLTRGRTHQVVTTVTERRPAEAILQVIWAASQQLPHTADCSPQLIDEAYNLMQAIEPPAVVLGVADALNTARTIWQSGVEPGFSASHHLIGICVALLQMSEDLPTASVDIPNGTATFLDLERLWEICVLRMSERAFSPDATVEYHGLSSANVTVFEDGGPPIDPDIVVLNDKLSVVGVVDAKYKRNEFAKVSSSDVYQMAGYTSRVGAKLGIIAQFSESTTWGEVVGHTREGARIIALSVSAKTLLSDGDCSIANILVDRGLLQGL